MSRFAVKLMERGGPIEVWHSLELVPCFLAVLAVSDFARSVSREY